MEMPDKKVTVVDKESGVTYIVVAYRELKPDEARACVRHYLSSRKRKPKRGSKVTIITTFGA